jgi:hypothetical protein
MNQDIGNIKILGHTDMLVPGGYLATFPLNRISNEFIDLEK